MLHYKNFFFFLIHSCISLFDFYLYKKQRSLCLSFLKIKFRTAKSAFVLPACVILPVISHQAGCKPVQMLSASVTETF